MKQVFITGSSKGLGKALAEKYLESGDKVVGISRTNEINHHNFSHIKADLSQLKELENFKFELEKDASEYILYNNAGKLGEIKYHGNWSLAEIESTYRVNVIAPLYLINLFIKSTSNSNKKKYVINIGSGAGERPIDGWGLYGSTKAALHMASRILDTEIEIQQMTNLKQLTISPGVIDTEMQTEIRKADHKQFSQLDSFKEYKSEGALANPKEVADKILRNFMKLFNEKNSIIHLRNYK